MTINIPLAPVPASRPRVSKHGTYYSKTYAEYKKNAAKLIRCEKMDGPVELWITFYMPIPKSTRKKDLPFMDGAPHISRPDLDNLVKATLDMLSGKAFDDDCQVARMHVEKVYGFDPCTMVVIKSFEM